MHRSTVQVVEIAESQVAQYSRRCRNGQGSRSDCPTCSHARDSTENLKRSDWVTLLSKIFVDRYPSIALCGASSSGMSHCIAAAAKHSHTSHPVQPRKPGTPPESYMNQLRLTPNRPKVLEIGRKRERDELIERLQVSVMHQHQI